MSFGRKKTPAANKHIANVNGLRVSICCDPDGSYNNWVRELQRARLEVTNIWPPPSGRLSADMDILICDYFPRMGDLITWMPGDDAMAALIVVLPQNGQYDDSLVLSVAPQCVIQRPFANSLLATTVKVAWSQFRYERRLLDRVSKLDGIVRTVRDVERAKLIIMNDKNIDEAAAYRHLRDLAMKHRLTVSSLATDIVQAPNRTFLP